MYAVQEVHEWRDDNHKYTASLKLCRTKREAKEVFLKDLCELASPRDWMISEMCEEQGVDYDNKFGKPNPNWDESVRKLVSKYVSKGKYYYNDGSDMIKFEIILLGMAETLEFNSKLRGGRNG